jgi:hypothetical protein
MAASNETLELQQKGAGAGPLTAGHRARTQPLDQWRCSAGFIARMAVEGRESLAHA